jgi:hypothetical protein
MITTTITVGAKLASPAAAATIASQGDHSAAPPFPFPFPFPFTVSIVRAGITAWYSGVNPRRYDDLPRLAPSNARWSSGQPLRGFRQPVPEDLL